jgi:DNA ligase-1
MLSATLEDTSSVRWPVLCSPKLDGIRCLMNGRTPMTRNGKPIPNKAIRDTLYGLNLPAFDGELVVGSPKAKDCYRVTNSGVMSHDGEPDWVLWVFDLIGDGPFEDRLAMAKKLVSRVGHKRIRFVTHVLVKDEEQLLEYEKNHLLAGYEGVMGRSLGGTYKQGRSTLREGMLWKLKRFSDGEAKIVGFDEQMHNANEAKRNIFGRTERSSHKENMVPKGTLGALKVVDTESGVDFDIGTGFTDEERALIWANRDSWMGVTVKYKSMTVGVKDRPRHPVYLGLRKDL